jgi:hypothetical protein
MMRHQSSPLLNVVTHQVVHAVAIMQHCQRLHCCITVVMVAGDLLQLVLMHAVFVHGVVRWEPPVSCINSLPCVTHSVLAGHGCIETQPGMLHSWYLQVSLQHFSIAAAWLQTFVVLVSTIAKVKVG